MVWLFTLLIFISFIMGLLNAPSWIMFIVFIIFIAAVMYMTLYPALYEKNIDKIMNYLKKSKNEHNQFLFHLYCGNLAEAEKAVKTIKNEQLQHFANMALLINQNKLTEAKKYLPKLMDNEFKSYYCAMLALKDNDLTTFEENLANIKDPLHRSYLDIEKLMHSGKKQEAFAMLEEQIRKLRGLKLLSAVQYKKEMEQKVA
ncbi:hypothetical protein [Bacillus sp. T3]|uniref:hypothetical protein n=1 Tax=Bacillus sp. T3 TaxID=467262 RepID=UPI002980E4F3|nr:hypothetical protein [Bacillus sp. T3]